LRALMRAQSVRPEPALRAFLAGMVYLSFFPTRRVLS
jgi:hypothetical protein